jgi:hypothetical protein
MPELLVRRRSSRWHNSAPGGTGHVAVDCFPNAAGQDRGVQETHGLAFSMVSSFGSDFNYDYHVSFAPEQKTTGKVDYNYVMGRFPSAEAPGLSVFYKDSQTGEIFHTYSAYARGLDPLIVTYALLDLVPKGRDEDALEFPMGWLRHHDRYGTDVFLDPTRPYWPPNAPLASSTSSCSACAPTERQS